MLKECGDLLGTLLMRRILGSIGALCSARLWRMGLGKQSICKLCSLRRKNPFILDGFERDYLDVELGLSLFVVSGNLFRILK